MWHVLKELILTVSTLGRYGSLERTDFNTVYFGKVWWWLKELILTVSTFVMLLKELSNVSTCVAVKRTDFNCFYFGKVWQS